MKHDLENFTDHDLREFIMSPYNPESLKRAALALLETRAFNKGAEQMKGATK